MNCRGCIEEMHYAYWMQEHGYYICYMDVNGHFMFTALNNRMRIVAE